jgi:hypothetical protein
MDPLDQYLAPGANTDPLDDWLRQQAQARAAASLYQPGNPDQAGKANRLSRQMGLPAETVERNLDTVEREARLRRFKTLMDRDPRIADFLGEPRNAAVAKDDLDALEKNARYWRQASSGSLTAVPAPKPTFGNYLRGIGASFYEGGVQALQGLRSVAADFFPDAAPRSAPGVPRLGDFGQQNAQTAYQRSVARSDAAAPAFKSWWARDVYSGVSSFAQMTPGIVASIATANPTPAIAMAGLQQGLPVYAKYRSRGATPGQATLGAGLEGGAEAAGEVLPMGFLVNKLGKIGLKPFLAGFLGRELPSELATTIAQNATDVAIANPDKTWGDFWNELPADLRTTAVSVAVMGGAGGALNTAASRLNVREAEQTRAAEAAQTVAQVMDAAAESKVRQRDPEAFASLIERLAQGSPAEKLFVPADKLVEYFQSHDIDYSSDPFWGSYSDEIDQGLATGGDVVVPTAQAAAHLAGTPAWEAIRPEVRVTPGGMSLSEAEAFERDKAAELEKMGAEMAAQMEADRAAMEPRQKIVESVRDRLMQAGYTPDAALVNAELVAARYATRAARLGQELTGTEADKIEIRRVLPEGLAPAVAADQLDLVIAAMRGGKASTAKRGPSLLEWIAAKGGNEDRGGDIAAMGGNEWHRGRPGRRKLLRESTRDQMAAFGTANQNTPDALAQAAWEAGYFPGLTERPDVNTLLDAIGEELRGNARHAETDTSATVDMRAAAEDLRGLLESRGLDGDKATPKQIRDAVAQYQQEQSSGALFQTPERVLRFANYPELSSALADDLISALKGVDGLEVQFGASNQSASRYVNIEVLDEDGFFEGDGFKLRFSDHPDRHGADKTIRFDSVVDDIEDEGEHVATEIDAERYNELLQQGLEAVRDWLRTERPELTDSIPRTYEQTFGDMPRGSVTFADGKSIIQLFESSNLSTFAHEFGHITLEELRQDGGQDWATVQAWFAANGHPISDDGAIPVEAHELWARGFERFLMEGKAPSTALRRVFDTFRSWLLQIYKVVQNLRSPITPEIREVMERMIATDEEIAAAREKQQMAELFKSAADANMTEAEFAAYREAAQGARDAAFDALLYRTMQTIRQARTAWWRDEDRGVRADVTERINRRPEFRALHLLRTGKLLDMPDAEPIRAKLDTAWLVQTYGEDVLKALPKAVPPIFSHERSTDVDAIAEMVGFRTGDEMVRTLIGLEQRQAELRAEGDKRSVKQRLIDEETAAEMRDRHGDPLNDGSIEEEALAAVLNERQGEVIASELRALQRKRRSDAPPTPYSLAKEWAARTIREGLVVDVASPAAVQRYARAAAKAAKEAEAAILKGDVDETYRQKQRQMLNAALVSEARKAGEAVDAAVARLGKLAKRATIKSVDQGYLDQAHALLEQVEFRNRSQASLDRQESFAEWARERQAEGHDVVVPESFAESLGTTHWSRLSVENLLGLDETVKQIIHLGRLKQKLIDGQEEREFNAVVDEAVASASQLPPRPPSDLMDPSWRDRFKAGVADADAALLKLETIFDWLDGGNSDGVFNRIAFRPIAEAQTREQDMFADYSKRLTEALASVDAKTLRRWSDHVTVPELVNRETGNPLTFSRQQLVSMALNMGNEGNAQRLADGYGWNEAAILDVLNRELSAEEWGYVQKVWDIIDGLWPEIEAMEKRLNGVAPEKVAARPLETGAGTLRGGYFPAVYDSTRDYRAEANAGRESDLFEAKYTRATTVASATKDRLEKVSRPILLDLGVIQRHVGEVIHDITHREAVMNAHKFLSHPRVMKAVDETLGPAMRKQFRPWLKHVANSWAIEKAGNEGLGKFFSKLRTNATVVGMGFRLSTMLTQIAGYSNSFEVVGATWVSAAVAQTSRHPVETFNFVMQRSGEVRHRMDTLDRDINSGIKRLAGKTGRLSAAKRFAFHGIGYMDRVVVIPTWIGAYNKALAGGATEEDAIYAADKAIRQSQGAGAAKDLAAVQRGTGKYGEFFKLTTMFYSYLSAVYQRQRTLGRDVRAMSSRDLPGLMARAWWLVIVPPLLSEMLANRGPDDDEDWGWWAFKQMLFQSLGAFPGIRDVARPIWDELAGNKAFDYQLSPVQRAGQSLVQVAGDAHNIATGDETRHATKDVLEAAGYWTGLVPGQVAAATQFLVDVGHGDADPQTVSDWYEGLTTGRLSDDHR